MMSDWARVVFRDWLKTGRLLSDRTLQFLLLFSCISISMRETQGLCFLGGGGGGGGGGGQGLKSLHLYPARFMKFE